MTGALFATDHRSVLYVRPTYKIVKYLPYPRVFKVSRLSTQGGLRNRAGISVGNTRPLPPTLHTVRKNTLFVTSRFLQEIHFKKLN